MGPPFAPRRSGKHGIDNHDQGSGDLPGPPFNPADDAEVPGTRTPGRRPVSPPGSNLRTGKEDKLGSSCWKLLEDLGAKKTEAPRGDTVGKGVNLCPPALQKVGDRT